MAYATRRSYAGAAPSCTLTNTISSGDTTISLTGDVTNWNTTASGPFYAVIDPGLATEEKILVASRASTVLSSVTRGVDGTVPAAHTAGAICYPIFTAVDADQANAVASALTTKGDLLVTDGSVLNRLPVNATDGYTLLTSAAATNGVVWGQVAAAGIATGAVTSAKILDATIVQGDLALTLLKALCPVGTISAYAGATAPTGWILCDGTAVVSGTHPELFAICATTPDLRGRFALGKATSGTGSTLLGTGGSTTIAEANLPSHTHSVTSNVSITNVNESAHTHANTLGGTTTFADILHGHIQTHVYTSTYQANNGSQYTNGGSVSNQDVSTGPATLGATVTLTNVAGSAHSHANTLTNNAVTSGGGTGSGTAYNQPFVAVNYIIKHDYV